MATCAACGVQTPAVFNGVCVACYGRAIPTHTLVPGPPPFVVTPFHDTDEVGAARRYVATHARDGVTCPVCYRDAKHRHRCLNSGMARTLFILDRHVPKDRDGWIDVPAVADHFMLRGREYQRLRHWDLVESKPGTQRTKTDNALGIWRVTALGSAFAACRLRVPVAIWTYRNTMVDVDNSEMVTIRDVLGFDYAKLLSM